MRSFHELTAVSLISLTCALRRSVECRLYSTVSPLADYASWAVQNRSYYRNEYMYQVRRFVSTSCREADFPIGLVHCSVCGH